jgi:hypothetical protein
MEHLNYTSAHPATWAFPVPWYDAQVLLLSAGIQPMSKLSTESDYYEYSERRIISPKPGDPRIKILEFI